MMSQKANKKASKVANKKLNMIDFAIICFVSILSAVYLFYFLQIFISGEYLAPRSDPMSYFLNARMFFENNLFQFIMLDEYEGKILGADVHGPMYPFFYGTFAKIFGFHNLNFIYLNLLFLIGMFILVLRTGFLSIRQKGLILIINLSYFISFWSAFTFTPELYHIIFANCIGIALIKIHRKYLEKTLSDKDILWLLGMILLFASFRYSWTLSAVAIIPFATDRKQFLKYCGLSFAVIAIGFAYLKLFHAPYYGLKLVEASQIAKNTGNIMAAFKFIFDGLISNLEMYFYKYYFSFYYFVAKMVFFFLVVFHAYKSVKDKDRLSASVLSLALMYFLSLLLFFDAFDFRDLRGLSGPLIVLALILVYQNYQKFSFAVALIFLLCFPFTFQGFHYFVYDLSVGSAKIYGKRDLSGFKKLKSNGSKLITVQINPPMYWELMPGRPLHIKNVLDTAAITLPVRNEEGVPIRYNVNNNTRPPYDLANRIKVDYVHILETGEIKVVSL